MAITFRKHTDQPGVYTVWRNGTAVGAQVKRDSWYLRGEHWMWRLPEHPDFADWTPGSRSRTEAGRAATEAVVELASA